MTRRFPHRFIAALLVLITLGLAPAQAAASQRLIVRTAPLLGVTGDVVIGLVCRLVGCKVEYGLDGAIGKVFLVSIPDVLDLRFALTLLRSLTGIEAVEVDQVVNTASGGQASEVPPALMDKQPMQYYGATVRHGYVYQPATRIIGLQAAQKEFGMTGRGIRVAVIDTGVDPNHPVLKPVLVAGYDFTRNRAGGSEMGDISQSTMAVLDGGGNGEPAMVNQSTMAVLDDDQSTVAVLDDDQSTVAVLDTPEYAAFGHGTMVAGAIHLVAPRATIMPLKAFRANGDGYASDVLRAVYYAVRENAKVINMSFNFAANSRELQRALEYASSKGVIGVASTGNNGQKVTVYPAGLPTVVGVASTTDFDTLSDFSNFGPEAAWIAAPGEGVVTTYPWGKWAAAWGTSFSTPLASGTAALLAEVASHVSSKQVHDSEGNAVWISHEVTKGRLDVPAAVRAWKKNLGSSALFGLLSN